MDWLSFGILLNSNITLYIILLIASLTLYFILFKRIYISILDPLIFSLVFSAFGFSVVWFLYFTASIDSKYLISYLLTQVAFWAGLFSFKSLNKTQLLSNHKIIVFEKEGSFIKVLFIITSLLYIMLQLLSYTLIGVPLFLGTHIDIYSGSGGLGLIGRFIDVVKPISIFMLIYFLFNKKYHLLFKIYLYFFFFLLLVFFALSGSKGEFMYLGFIFFCFLLLNADRFKKSFFNIKKFEIAILIAGLFFVFLTIMQSKDDELGMNSFGLFLFRLVASGDVYYFSYPNNNIELINGSKSFLALFGDIFSTLRLIPRENQPVPVGVQLYRMFSSLEETAGPNARHNVFGYVYFGFYISIVFSYLIGLLLSFVRNKLFFKLKRNIIGQLVFILLYVTLTSIETDPPMVFSNLENAFLIFPLIIAISFSIFLLLITVPSLSKSNL